MKIITERDVYSYAGDDKQPTKVEKQEQRKKKRQELKGKFSEVEKNPLFQAAASTAGQFLQNKYGQTGFNVTRDNEGNIVAGTNTGSNTLVIGETEQEKAAREKKEKSKKIIIWSAVGVGVIVIGIIAYRMYSKKK
jgi:hypothetical protein